MVRASTSGMINFSEFDPWDTWWQRKLQWTINELSSQNVREISTVQHNHWVTLAAHGNLSDESFDKAKANAQDALNKLLKATYPWLTDAIGKDSAKTASEEAVEAYHERFGRPGDPKYDIMVDTLMKALKKGKLTQYEKEKDRARRRAKREAMRQSGG